VWNYNALSRYENRLSSSCTKASKRSNGVLTQSTLVGTGAVRAHMLILAPNPTRDDN
jgi:hypothetical protein